MEPGTQWNNQCAEAKVLYHGPLEIVPRKDTMEEIQIMVEK